MSGVDMEKSNNLAVMRLLEVYDSSSTYYEENFNNSKFLTEYSTDKIEIHKNIFLMHPEVLSNFLEYEQWKKDQENINIVFPYNEKIKFNIKDNLWQNDYDIMCNFTFVGTIRNSPWNKVDGLYEKEYVCNFLNQIKRFEHE